MSYTVKKVSDFPYPAGKSLTKLFLAGNTYIFPARDSLVSDIPLCTGKSLTFFCSVIIKLIIDYTVRVGSVGTPFTKMIQVYLKSYIFLFYLRDIDKSKDTDWTGTWTVQHF